MLVMQLTAIQTSFGQSCTVLEHRFKNATLYSWLGGYMSRYALGNIVLKRNIVGNIVHGQGNLWLCSKDIVWTTTCMLYCYKICDDKHILLDEIHHHWHKLSMGQESNEDGFSVEEEWNGIKNVSRKSLIK